MNENGRILLVEDDSRLAGLVRDYLEQNHYPTTVVGDGHVAVDAILNDKPDLVILDVLLPGISGLEVCRTVRGQYNGKILMLTALEEDTEQIVGLEVGADDYVVKPAHPRVLLARVRALLRRQSTFVDRPYRDELVLGELRISKRTRSVHLSGSELPLTTAEFDLLWILAERAGEVLTRDEILNRMRGVRYDGLDRTIDNKVSALRRRLGDDLNRPKLILTVRGKGYLFSMDAW